MLAGGGAAMTMKVTPDDMLVVHYEQDVEPILQLNAHAYNEASENATRRKGDLHRVASVPEVVVYLWKRMYGFDLQKFHPNSETDQRMLKRLLNDNDWLKLRTAPGVY